ncbi:MAG: Ig-like domain repeat protein [Vulcanisaeta sp.]
MSLISALVLHIILLMISADPGVPISVNNATWYYGAYAEAIGNNTSIYTGAGINATVSMIITNNLQSPVNATITLSVGGSTQSVTETLKPGTNIINITAPALGMGTYNASLVMTTTSYSLTYSFRVLYLKPGITITTTANKLYSGLPQQITVDVVNSTPIPITSATISIMGVNAQVMPSIMNVKPPTNASLTLTPGSYLLGNASLIIRATYTDAGGYVWSSNYTLVIPIVQTPVNLTVNVKSYVVSYGSSLPITITAQTPVGPLANQPLSIYVDGNYVASILTNNSGAARYVLLINYNVGYHVLTISFMNTTYFQGVTINYTLTVVPGTVYVTVNVNSTNITYGGAVSMVITTSPPVSGGTLTISYVIDGVSSVVGSYTPVNGTVHVTWIPPEAGKYLITVYYQNPPNYLPSMTNLTLTVNKATCALSIMIRGTPVVFHDVVIIGQMNPVIVNAGVNVVISGRNYTTSGVIYINSSGFGEYVFTPQLPGYYEVVMEWPGNINYEPCQASYALIVNKASLSMSIRESRDLIAMGGEVTFTIDLITDIPINYVTGDVVITVEGSKGVVKTLSIPIRDAHIVVVIPFYEPGNYRVFIEYPGNDYVNSTTYGPYYVTVLPGLLGIPWYVLTAYLLSLGLGAAIGLVMNRKITKQFS